MTARTLYLGDSLPKRIAHSEHALLVHTASGQTHRYPLGRIARILAGPAVQWDGSALAQCLRHGIPITWTDPKGHPLGSAIPHSPSLHPAATRLAILLESPHGPDAYANWLRSRRMVILVQWARAQTRRTNPREWEALKRSWVYAGRAPADHLPATWHAYLLSWVIAQLHARCLPCELVDARGTTVALARDIAHLLWAELNLSASSTSGPSPPAQEPGAQVSEFEKSLLPHGASLSLHLGALLRLAHATASEP